MTKQRTHSDPQLTEAHGILRKIKNTAVLKWKISSLLERLAKLKTIQEQRGSGLFGMDITPEIEFLEVALKIKQAA